MRQLQQFPIVVLGLVMLAIAALCTAQRSVELLLVAGTLAAASWYVTEGPRGRMLPRWASNLLLAGLLVSLVADLWLPPADLLRTIGRFSVGLALIKLYERRTARDHAQLMGLSLVLVLIGSLQSQALLFGVILVLYAGLGLYAVLLYQLYAAHEASGAAETGPLGPSPGTGRRFALHLRGIGAAIALAGLAFSLLLFVVFPRAIGRGILAGPTASLRGGPRATGYTDEIDLVAGTRISPSRRAVLDLELLDAAGTPMRGDGPLLLRGAVLEHYGNGRWSAGAAGQRVLEAGGVVAAPLFTGPPSACDVVRQRVTLHQPSSTVFALYAPLAVRTPGRQAIAYTPGTQTLTTVAPGEVWAYTVDSCPDPDPATLASLVGGELDGRIDPVGPRDARVPALAHRLLREHGIAATPPADERWRWNAMASATLASFLRDGGFRYTLDVGDVLARDADPIAAFLFETRRGHCEFFASALVELCRSVGIEARLVSGYLACEYDEQARRYRVLASHAHAWAEVRTGAHAYMPLDPTPARVIEDRERASASLAERFTWLYQRFEGRWMSRVVLFDDREQARIFRALEERVAGHVGTARTAVRDWMASVNRFFNVGPGGYIWLGIVGLALVIAAFAAVSVIRRYGALRRTLRLQRLPAAQSQRLARQLGFYADMLDALARRGAEKPPWQPPLDYAAALGTRHPRAGALVGEIARTYYEARYARRRLAPADVARARALVRELSAALATVPSREATRS